MSESPITQPSDDDVVSAYLYLFARLLVARQENYDINVEGVGWNQIKYNPVGSAEFVNPNLDVAYLEAWVAVDAEHAVTLEVPQISGRYYTVQIMDVWGEVIANVNERNNADHPAGTIAFRLAGSTPQSTLAPWSSTCPVPRPRSWPGSSSRTPPTPR